MRQKTFEALQHLNRFANFVHSYVTPLILAAYLARNGWTLAAVVVSASVIVAAATPEG